MTGREMESRCPDPGDTMIERKTFSKLSVVELHDIFELRSQVFVVEQECAYHDIDGRDAESTTTHWWIRVDEVIAAYLRQLADGPDHAGHQHIARIGRVATRQGYRKRGLAGLLVRSVIDTQPGPIVLDAQAALEGWYEGFGFARSGPEFVEDGIPHVPMYRQPRSHQPNCP